MGGLLVSGASTRPCPRSIHGAPHALTADVSKVTHAHVAALQDLWTSNAGIPRQHRLSSSATSGVCSSATNLIWTARVRRIYASLPPQHPWGTSRADGRRKQGHTRPRGRPARPMDKRCWHPPSAPPLIVGYVGCLLERHQLDLACSCPAHLRVLAPAASMGHLTR